MQLAIIFLGPSSKVYTVDDIKFTLEDSTAAYNSAWNAFPAPANTAYSTTTNPPMSTQTSTVSSLTLSSTASLALACNTAPVISHKQRRIRVRLCSAMECLGIPSSGYTIIDQVFPNSRAGVEYTVSTEVQTSVYNPQFSEIVLQVWDTGYLHYQVVFDTMLPRPAVNNWFSVSGNFVSSGNGLILRFIMLADLVDTYYTLDSVVLSVAGSSPSTTSSSTLSAVSSSTTTSPTLTSSSRPKVRGSDLQLAHNITTLRAKRTHTKVPNRCFKKDPILETLLFNLLVKIGFMARKRETKWLLPTWIPKVFRKGLQPL
ncbi:hypothetical protein BDZ45DRAFT_753610 [Acephala macrosclerotiorum]|nr:hypothetical protein BDZ45DRAFT_753610 [Acephala macrosclerotiorum]